MDIRPALLLALTRFISDVPWYIVGCAPFMDSLRVKKSTLFFYILGVGITRALVNFALMALVPEGYKYLGAEYVVFTAVIILFYILAMKIRPAQLVYIMLLLQALATTVNYLAFVVNVPFYEEGAILAATAPSYVLAITGGTLLCVYPVWHLFRNYLRPALEALPNRAVWMLCIPPVMFWLVHQVYNSMVAHSQSTLNITILNVLILLTGLTVYYLNIKMVLDSAQHVRKESEAETRLALQAQNYENLTQSIETARAARHDLRHHLGVLKDFAARDDKEGILSYLEEYAADLPTDDVPDWCENQTVNALLRHYLDKAAKAGTRLDVKIALPRNSGIADTDLCVVFGNLFENAARAAATAGEGSFIHARCECSETDLVLTIENSIKQDMPRGEGLGLKNVEAVAKKYKGSTRFEKTDSSYKSRVILRK